MVSLVHICITNYVKFSKNRAKLMQNGYFGVLLSIALVVVIASAFNILGGVILVLFYGLDIKGGSPTIIILVNSISQLLMMLFVPIIITRSVNQDFFSTFRLEGMSETRVPVHLIGIPIIILGQIFGGAVASLWQYSLSQFPDLYSKLETFQKTIDDMMSGLTTAHSPSELAVLLLGVAIIPAFCEESFFRGFIQTNIERSGKNRSRPYVAIIIGSILFAAVHVNPMQFPGLIILGLLLGWLAYRTCDLRVSALAHAFNNGAIVIILYLMKDNPEAAAKMAGSDVLPVNTSIALLGASLPILIGLLFVFQKMTEPLMARKNADILIRQYTFSEEKNYTTNNE